MKALLLSFCLVLCCVPAVAQNVSTSPSSALDEAQQKISKLEAENESLKSLNEKLWKIALKDQAQQQAPTVVVQQPPQPSEAELNAQRAQRYEEEKSARHQQMIQNWIALQNANRPQPYVLPQPVNPNSGRLRTDCTTSVSGNTTYTNCN